MGSGGKLGVAPVMDGSTGGGAMMSYLVFRWTEGRARETSSQGDVMARPAAGGEGMATLRPWKDRCVTMSGMRRMVRRSRSKEAARQAPEESPAMIMREAGTGVWKAFGGGERRERYATRASRRAAGKVLWGERR